MTDVAREIVDEASRDYFGEMWVGGVPVKLICIQDYELQGIIEKALAKAYGKAPGITPEEMTAAVKTLASEVKYTVDQETLGQLAVDMACCGEWYAEPDGNGQLHRIEPRAICAIPNGKGGTEGYLVTVGGHHVVFRGDELLHLRLAFASNPAHISDDPREPETPSAKYKTAGTDLW